MVKSNVEMDEFGDVRPLIIFALHNGPVDGAVNKTTGYITNKVENEIWNFVFELCRQNVKRGLTGWTELVD